MKLHERVKLATQILIGKSSGSRSTEFINLLKWLGVDPDKEGSALSEATYFACLKVLSESIGKLPIRVLKYNELHGVRSARDHPLFRMIHDRPNPYMTSSVFWSTLEYNRNHYGNGYAWIDGAGTDMKLWILPSDQVEIWYDDAKILADNPDIYYLYSGGGKYYRFSSEEIIHVKSSNTLDGIEGISVRDQLRSTIVGATKSQKLVNKMYDSGFTAKAVLNYTGSLNDANVKELVKLTEAYGKGELKQEGIENIIPIPVGFSLNPLNIKLADNQFIEVKQYTALQIASAFGIKPYQIGDYTKSSYASAEAQQLSFYVDTLLYIVKQYEEELTYKLLTQKEVADGLHIKFNVAVILRADLQTQINTLSTAVNSFIYTPNEARELLDKEAVPGGDELLGNGASIPVKYAGSQYTQIENGGDEPTEQTEDSSNPNEIITIIENVRNGTLTYDQAVALITVTIGYDKPTAEQLLGKREDYEKEDPQPEENIEDEPPEETTEEPSEDDEIEEEEPTAEEDTEDNQEEERG